ncbi:hypothetical protein L484_022630 [Morus notabilis]|uniref:Uncharacterized protein n=1 Tax=Morus notabilis TaxID=981085 RepID=W9RIZ7_9ROSA|nr:hypothetical protein L484_022630 [Morus notabilis]
MVYQKPNEYLKDWMTRFDKAVAATTYRSSRSPFCQSIRSVEGCPRFCPKGSGGVRRHPFEIATTLFPLQARSSDPGTRAYAKAITAVAMKSLK